MAGVPISLVAPHPSWFSPKILLTIFCIINMLNYIDRGTIASNGVNGSSRTCTESGTCTSGSGIQGDFDLSNFEDGVLSSAFMVGLLISSPVFASLAKSINPFRLIGFGLSVWTFALMAMLDTILLSLLVIMLLARLVGVGEASFVSLAAPFIDDNAPADQKTAWLAIFYMCIPTGYAIGYVYGGLVGSNFNWRFAFWGEAILMLPFAILGFVMKPLQLKGFAPIQSKKAPSDIETSPCETQDVEFKDGKTSMKDVCTGKCSTISSRLIGSSYWDHMSRFTKDTRVLLSDKVYVVNALGAIAYNFVLGAYSYWGPKAGYNIYNMTDADLIFGGITVFTGIVGTLAGGYILDYISSTIPNAFKLLSVATFLGAICCFSAFCFKSMYPFLALFAVGELLVFATQAPVNYINLHCVKPSMRPLSMAIATVAIHVFGDVPSSPLVGVLQDYVNNWRETALILTAILFPAAGFWFIGTFLPSVDKFNEESESDSTAAHESSTTPLLEEKATETTESTT